MAFLGCVPTLLTDRFVRTSFSSQHNCSPTRTPTADRTSIQPAPLELPYHVRETFRKLLHIPHAAFMRQEGVFWKRALGRGRSWCVTRGAFLELRLLQELEQRCRHITWYKIRAENPAAAVEHGQAQLGCRYCWKPTLPSKELSMTTTLFDADIELDFSNGS